MNHNTNNKEDDEVAVTASKLSWLEEKLAGTTDKEEKKSIEASILLAQTEHKQALIKGAADARVRANNGDENYTNMISKGVAEVVILDEDNDNDHEMSTENNKRVNGEENEKTDNEKKSKVDEGEWTVVVPKGVANGNGEAQGKGVSNGNGGAQGKGKGNKVEEAKKMKPKKLIDYLLTPTQTSPKSPPTSALKNPYRTPPSTLNFAAAARNKIGQVLKTTNMVRIRFSFRGNQSDPSEIGFGEEIKRVLTVFSKVMKEVDNASKILTWESQEEVELGIGKQDIELLSPTGAKDYLDVPQYIKTFGTRKNSRIGIRVATNLELRVFVETWNSLKPRGQADWMSVNPSEMQTSATAFAVGFLQGSSEKKVITTINKNLQDELNCKAEVSWQYMKQSGVTEKLWDEANEYAEKKVGTKANQFNRIKFSMGPSALIVYVANKSDVKTTRKLLLTVYGKEFENKWPQWSDGSRMKFVPLLGGEIQNDKAREQVTTRMKWQIHSKANEVTLELPLYDIHERKIYLNNQSMEQVILGTMTKNDQNLPLFKHVTHKYTRNPAETKYQVTVYKAMEKEAVQRLEEMKDVMHTQFGNEVFGHFENKHKGLLNSYAKRRDNRLESEDYDEETENWLLDLHTTDKEGVLEPGFTALFTVEEIKGTDSTIHEESTTKKSDDSDSDDSANTTGTNFTAVSDVSCVSDYSTTSALSWMEQPQSKNSKEWRDGSRVQKKLDAAQITSAELDEWKSKNAAKMGFLKEANDDNVYKATSQAIKIMTKERTRYREDQEKVNPNTGTAAAEPPGRQN